MRASLRVLLADDNADMRQLFIDLLEETPGVELDLAENGAEAVEAVRGKQYQLIFLDVRMPGLDGITAAKQIRRLAPKTPVCILTGSGEVEPDAGLAELQVDVLYKPFQIEKILRTIDACRDQPVLANDQR